MNKTWVLTLGLALAASAAVGCGKNASPTSSGNPATPAAAVVFDTGRGTGQYDAMTYARYTSEMVIIPATDIAVRSIRPQIYYVNGSAVFTATLSDSSGNMLASEVGLVDGTDRMPPMFDDRHMEPTGVVLRAGLKYRIQMETWTTLSVGIYTTGARTTGIVGGGSFVVDRAYSDTADHLDRGAVACEILQ